MDGRVEATVDVVGGFAVVGDGGRRVVGVGGMVGDADVVVGDADVVVGRMSAGMLVVVVSGTVVGSAAGESERGAGTTAGDRAAPESSRAMLARRIRTASVPPAHPIKAVSAGQPGDLNWPMTTLVVLDQGDPIAISFEDILKYHGRSSIAGAAHAFKAMERAFPLLSPGGPPNREEITIEAGFPGGGARDGFEMVTRAVTGDRFAPASGPPTAEAPEAPGGHFFFRLAYRGTVVELIARADLIPAEFLEFACKDNPTPAEATRAQELKEDMAERLLSLPAEQVYDATVV